MSFEVSQQNELQNFITKIEKYSHKNIFQAKRNLVSFLAVIGKKMIPLWQFFLIKLADNVWNTYQLNNSQKSMA